MNYKDVNDPACVVTFPLVTDPSVCLLAWTTTPWTLPSNLGTSPPPSLSTLHHLPLPLSLLLITSFNHYSSPPLSPSLTTPHHLSLPLSLLLTTSLSLIAPHLSIFHLLTTSLSKQSRSLKSTKALTTLLQLFQYRAPSECHSFFINEHIDSVEGDMLAELHPLLICLVGHFTSI